MPSYAQLDEDFDYSLESAAYALFVVDRNTAEHLYSRTKEIHNVDLFKYYEELFGEKYDRDVHVINDTILPNDDASFVAEEEAEAIDLDYSTSYIEGFDDDGYIDAPISVAKGYASIIKLTSTMDVDPSEAEDVDLDLAAEQVIENPSFDMAYLKLLNSASSFKKMHFTADKLPSQPYCVKLAPILIHSFRMQLGKRPAKSPCLKCKLFRNELGECFIFTVGDDNLILSNCAEMFTSNDFEWRKYLGGIFHYHRGSDFERIMNLVTKSFMWHGLSLAEPDSIATSKKRTCRTPAPGDQEEGGVP